MSLERALGLIVFVIVLIILVAVMFRVLPA